MEARAVWRGEPGAFAAAFRAHYQEPDGTLRAWEKWNGALIRRYKGERTRKKAKRESFYSMSAGKGDGQSVGQGAGTVVNAARVPDLTGPDLTGPNYKLRGAASQPREAGPRKGRAQTTDIEALPKVTWLTPIGAAWEALYGVGSFPYPQAARELAPLQKAGLTPEEIARRLGFYLANKGSETVLDPEALKRRHFTPSLKDFRQRHGQFDPSAAEAA